MQLVIYYSIFAHILGDFYFQNKELIKKKHESVKYQALHTIIHLLCLLPLLFYQFSIRMIAYILIISTLHFMVDVFKYGIKFDKKYDLMAFLLDQGLHIVLILIFSNIMVQPTSYAFSRLYRLLFLLLPVLIMIRPVDVLIEIVFSVIHLKDSEDESSPSKWIGYIERILFSILIILNLESFVAVFIGVKTASRWNEVQNNKLFGLQFYIGTFISVVAGLITGLILKRYLI
ncbi:DUF3307 domain-containing protein [Acidaminobacter sp. JC074]|uniref:DUF3307 domain-containing protein n=1 Tax=Acidaminobacter sp. JC074 TaxID=2530199 RepID=UPI001F0E0E40|nr:DUF3307 domain-containing protein [Acidaminobacter sp. JC074]MCH4886488.1 DUF3307 domain-containing protein [Acidaminobacter sp. JC074]